MPSRTDDLRLPRLAAIQAFGAAARLGSFEKASDQLCVIASAVGKRIAALEKMVGVPLFTRSARGLTLSVAGAEYQNQVRTALALLADDLSIPYLDLSPPDTDLQIRFGQGVYAGWTTTRLITEDIFPVCAPAYLASLNGLAEPDDLARAALLRSPLEPWRPWFDAAGLDWAEPTAGPRLVDLGMLLEAAVNSQGVALARQTLAQTWLDAGTLAPRQEKDSTCLPAGPCTAIEGSSPCEPATTSPCCWVCTLRWRHARERDQPVCFASERRLR